MIIGHGDIASVLPDREDLLFFASGVSNSGETRESEYDRELNLLMAQNKSSHIVYFSSLAILERDTRYTRHKRAMEAQVKFNFGHYCIVRLGNIDWGTNPHTFINYLREHPEAEIKDEYRYVVDRDEFLYWIGKIPTWSCELSIPGRR